MRANSAPQIFLAIFEGQLRGREKRKKGRAKEKKERYEGTEWMGAEHPLAEINFLNDFDNYNDFRQLKYHSPHVYVVCVCLSARRSNTALSRRRYIVTPVDKRILLRTGLFNSVLLMSQLQETTSQHGPCAFYLLPLVKLFSVRSQCCYYGDAVLLSVTRASVFTGDRKISWNEFTFSLASGFKLLQPICICRTEFVRNFTA